MLSWVTGPPFLLSVAAAIGYAVARSRRRVTRPRRTWPVAADSRRAAAFYLGLVVVAFALGSPFDSLADRLFAVHMLQHVLLVFVAAPLFVHGAPWLAPLRLLPRRLHRPVAGTVAGWHSSSWWATVRPFVGPGLAWLAFTVDLWAWHLPPLYDATLRHQGVHDLEHVTFLVLGIGFWTPVMDSPPLRSALGGLQRCVYLVAAMASSWVLAFALVLAPHPLYAPYAGELHRPGGLSALADQQLAAGVMWGPGSVPLSVALFVAIYGWLGGDGSRQQRRRPARRGPSGLASPSWQPRSGRTA